MNSLMSINEIQSTAKHFIDSKLFNDVRQLSEAVVKIQAGQEIGLKPFQSMAGFDIIQGKMVLKPYAMASIVKASGKYTFKSIKHDDTICILEWYENKEKIGESSFSIEDAKQAGLLNKQVWKQYTKDMLFNRALSRGCRWYAMDAFNMPVYIEGEIEAQPIETKYEEVKPKPTIPTSKDDLINALNSKAKQYKDEKIDVDKIMMAIEKLANNRTSKVDAFYYRTFGKDAIEISNQEFWSVSKWLNLNGKPFEPADYMTIGFNNIVEGVE